MSHSSQVPEPAASYFASRGIFDHPIIVQAWLKDGWHRHPIRKKISGRAIRDMRRRGYTWIALEAGGRTADFRLDEFWTERVGLGQWRGQQTDRRPAWPDDYDTPGV